MVVDERLEQLARRPSRSRCIHTKTGARLLVTLVLGLSCAKVNLRWGARFFDHSSRSSAIDAMVRKETSYVADAGYSSVRARDRIRVMRKRASALESLVYSPGRVGRKPFSVMYSSSASTGYSQCTSSSRMSLGRPRWAAEKLWGSKRDVRGYGDCMRSLPVDGVQRPEDLLPGLTGQRIEREALL